MELGGNKNAAVYFEKNGMFMDGKPNHKAPQLSKYKQDLAKKAEQALGIMITNAQPIVQVETKKEDINNQF
jgi:hypothetical protein